MYFDKFSQNAAELFLISQKEADDLGHKIIDPVHILLAVCKVPSSIVYDILINQYEVQYEEIKEEVIKTTGQVHQNRLDQRGSTFSPQISPRLKGILANAFEESKNFSSPKIEIEHIFLAILRHNQNGVVRILSRLHISVNSLTKELMMKMNPNPDDFNNEPDEEFGSFNSSAENKSNSFLLKQLEEFGTNLNELEEAGKLDPVIGREVEIQRLMQILIRRKKNNPVLIGEPGVGKTAIVNGLVERIVKNKVPVILKNKIIFSLDMASLIAGTKYRGEFEKRMKKLIKIIQQEQNLIIFIDEIHTIVGAGAAEGAVDASNILKPALANGTIKCIGATTPDEYRKHIEKDAALERRFQKINVQEPDYTETIKILEGLKEKYELHHKVQYTEEAIKESVKLARTYISDHFLPDMAIDVLDEAGAKKRLSILKLPENLTEYEDRIALLKKQKQTAAKNNDFEEARRLQDEEKGLTEEYNREYLDWKTDAVNRIETVSFEDIAEVVSKWTGIPLTKIEEDESNKLLNMEEALHERVVGQNESIIAISKAIRRARSGLKDPKRPVGTFLFLGPTGVGKTELAKTLTEYLFGNEKALLRFDMSEYMERFSVSRLLGAPPGYVGYEEGGTLTEAVRRNPFSVILLDEIEKAHPDVYNILLQIADEGRLTDSQGRNIDFRNAILIMTSNIGGETINKSRNSMGFEIQQNEEMKYEDMKKTVMSEVKKIFRPEFLNRLDDIIVFHQLNREHISEIIDILLSGLSKRLEEKEINVELSKNAREFLIDKGYDPIYGARPLKRALQKFIEDPLAEELLSNRFKAGDTIKIVMNKTEGIKFQKKEFREEGKKLVGVGSAE
ncbi:MAG TPA: ATP-dependent Clp protease ATP-binding subunit [Thermotogota bacterium]|nr:ATP-dependent Clp protease ATP-binding subunit [Thermotogota bacterium]HPR95054.1 ATP-dependent Clp protease ATP-binding subunit [Thermotogota bacterium]